MFFFYVKASIELKSAQITSVYIKPGKQGDSKNGRGLYGAFSCDWKRRREYQKSDGGHILSYSFP